MVDCGVDTAVFRNATGLFPSLRVLLLLSKFSTVESTPSAVHHTSECETGRTKIITTSTIAQSTLQLEWPLGVIVILRTFFQAGNR